MSSPNRPQTVPQSPTESSKISPSVLNESIGKGKFADLLRKSTEPPKKLTVQTLMTLYAEIQAVNHKAIDLIYLALAHTVTVALVGDHEAVFEALDDRKSGAPDEATVATVVSQTETTLLKDLEVNRLGPDLVPEMHKILLFLLYTVQESPCKGYRNMDRGSPGIPVQEQGKLLAPFLKHPNPPAVELLPWMLAMRRCGGVIDGSLKCGATAQERSETYMLETKASTWCNKRPWVTKFLDPPAVFVFPVAMAQEPTLPALIPAGQMGGPLVDAADNAQPNGLYELTGNTGESRVLGDMLRGHYVDAVGGGGGGAPKTGTPYRIMTFTTTGAGGIQFH